MCFFVLVASSKQAPAPPPRQKVVPPPHQQPAPAAEMPKRRQTVPTADFDFATCTDDDLIFLYEGGTPAEAMEAKAEFERRNPGHTMEFVTEEEENPGVAALRRAVGSSFDSDDMLLSEGDGGGKKSDEKFDQFLNDTQKEVSIGVQNGKTLMAELNHDKNDKAAGGVAELDAKKEAAAVDAADREAAAAADRDELDAKNKADAAVNQRMFDIGEKMKAEPKDRRRKSQADRLQEKRELRTNQFRGRASEPTASRHGTRSASKALGITHESLFGREDTPTTNTQDDEEY